MKLSELFKYSTSKDHREYQVKWYLYSDWDTGHKVNLDKSNGKLITKGNYSLTVMSDWGEAITGS